jgi:RNA-directed DNA polymerase
MRELPKEVPYRQSWRTYSWTKSIKELEKRGHTFVRYADDLNVYVRSKRAVERVMEAMRRLYARLKLRINEAKSAVRVPRNESSSAFRLGSLQDGKSSCALHPKPGSA